MKIEIDIEATKKSAGEIGRAGDAFRTLLASPAPQGNPGFQTSAVIAQVDAFLAGLAQTEQRNLTALGLKIEASADGIARADEEARRVSERMRGDI